MAERGDEMYILSAGFVFAFDGMSDNVLLEFGPGDVFGENLAHLMSWVEDCFMFSVDQYVTSTRFQGQVLRKRLLNVQ